MRYWLQYAATRVVLLFLLVATAVMLIRYPAMWAPVAHSPRWGWVPAEAFLVARLLLPGLLAFGWVAYFIASHRVRRPQ